VREGLFRRRFLFINPEGEKKLPLPMQENRLADGIAAPDGQRTVAPNSTSPRRRKMDFDWIFRRPYWAIVQAREKC
jgi:hypothetical protein